MGRLSLLPSHSRRRGASQHVPNRANATNPADGTQAGQKSGHIRPHVDGLRDTAIAATVRVVNHTQKVQGSGVIIGSTGPFVYVLTARHLLADDDRLEIHTFSWESYPHIARTSQTASIVAGSDESDLCLLRVELRDHSVASLPICPAQWLPHDAPFAAITVGCSHGNAPTCVDSTVARSSIVQKHAEATPTRMWELSQPSVEGRSGGPLLSLRGYVLGIGSGASDSQAYYCHLEAIHTFLKRNGFNWLRELPAGGH